MSGLGGATAVPLRGIALMIAACASFALLDATVKVLCARYPAPMIAWARYFFHVAILLMIMWPRYGVRLFRTRRPGLQLVRGVCLGASSLFFFSALGFLPLAETSALASVAPILVTVAAVRWLGEKPPPGTAWALGMSFAGVLLIIRPGTELFGWAALLPLCTAVCGAGYQLATRRLSGVDDGITTLFLGGVVSVVLLLTVLPFYWAFPTSVLDALLFMLTGVIGAVGHLLLVRAYEYASASTLAPFSYAHAVTALPVGWLLFDAFPDDIALTGVSLIVLTGAWTAWRNHVPPSSTES